MLKEGLQTHLPVPVDAHDKPFNDPKRDLAVVFLAFICFALI